MKTVTIQVKGANGREWTRELDISNLCYEDGNGNNRVATSRAVQEMMLNDWIKDRGNEQHATELTLVDWHVNS